MKSKTSWEIRYIHLSSGFKSEIVTEDMLDKRLEEIKSDNVYLESIKTAPRG